MKRSFIILIWLFILNHTFSQQILHNGVVNVEQFGFSESNKNNSEALQKAIDYCKDDSSIQILIPAGKFIFRTPVLLSNTPLIGSKTGTTEFIMAEDFEFNKSLSSPRNGAFLYNKNFKRSFDANTANRIKLENIHFQANVESKESKAATILLLANIQNGSIINCSFVAKANNSLIANTLVDCYACVKNLVFRDCKIQNFNQKKSGGGMWIRNQTADGSNMVNATENISLKNVEIKQTSGDEALSIFGSGGMTRNILVDMCTFIGLSSSVPHSVLVSVFPLDGKFGGQYAGVKNIKIQNSNFIDSSYRNYILRVGGNAENDRDNVCDSVEISANRFFSYSKINTAKSAILSCVQNIGNNISAINNVINSYNTNYFGIKGFYRTMGNKMNGNKVRVDVADAREKM